MKIRKLSTLIAISAIMFLAQCSSKDKNSSTPPDSFEAPDASPNASNLESFYSNTFSTAGLSVSVAPKTLNFGTDLSLGEKTSLTFSLSTLSSLTFTLRISCTSGSFRFKDDEEDKNTAYWPDVTLAAGENKTFTVEFDAKRLGETSGYVIISAEGIDDASIKIPLYALIPAAADMQVIPASYMCGSETADSVEKVDFESIPVGLSKTESIKICNTGGDTFEIYSVSLKTDTTGDASKVFTDDRSIDEYSFTSDEIDFHEEENLYGIEGYFSPISYDTLPEVVATTSSVNQTSAFDIVDHSTETEPKNLVLDDGEYSKLDITFTPPSSLGLESSDTTLYLAPFAAELTIYTSLGEKKVTLLGASGGVEPSLAVSYSYTSKDEDGVESTTTGEVDLTSSGAAIDFGKLFKFTDWILEEGREVTLTLKNVGTKGPLKVWPDGLSETTKGFFTIKGDSLELPIEIEPGESQNLTLIYLPTDEEVSDSPDIGQLILHHNGGNGPSNSIMLVGQQEEDQAITATVDGKTLKTSYSRDKRKSLCSTDIGSISVKTFTITNHSTKFNLVPSVSVSRFITNGEGSILYGAKATLDTSTLTTDGVIPPGSSGTFTLNIQTPASTEVGTTMNGTVTIKNEYQNESAYDRQAQDYDIYYTVKATEDGVCTAGAASAPDGDSTILVDRIVMVMDGLAEPLRTFPKNKLQMKTYVDQENRSIVVKGIEYDPATDADKPNHKKFQPYNHQGTNPQVCFPLVDNALAAPTDTASNNTKGYKAWNDPSTQYYNDDEDFPIEEGTLCLPDKGAELELGDDGEYYYVFYHYFIKYDSDSNIEMKGRIATFYYPKSSTALAQYNKMETDVGSDGSLEEYMDYEGTGKFGSYITFNKAISLPNCSYEAGYTLEDDADAIIDCWSDFKEPAYGSLQRANGFIDTCSYFHFEVVKGCVPSDHPTADKLRAEGDPDELICTDSSITADDPDTWVGFGEYEPRIEDEEESETKMDMTIRNLGLYGAFLSHALNDFYTNNSKLMFVELHATLTTKPIGNDHDGSADEKWDDLIAPPNRDYVTQGMVYKELTSTYARDNFIEDGVNGFMNVTWDGEDTQECFDDAGNPYPMISCKGNYVISTDKKYLLMAGEPIYLEYGNRTILTGLVSFTAKGEMAPSFATGGKPVSFLLSACLKEGDDLDPEAGCYEEEWIDNLYPDYNIMAEYAELGIIDSPLMDDEEGDPRAKIDFRPIVPRDFDQFTNYWAAPDNFYLDTNFYSTGTTCGYGM